MILGSVSCLIPRNLPDRWPKVLALIFSACQSCYLQLGCFFLVFFCHGTSLGSFDGKVRRKSIFGERHRSGLKCKVSNTSKILLTAAMGQAWLAYVVVTMMGFNHGNPAKLYLSTRLQRCLLRCGLFVLQICVWNCTWETRSFLRKFHHECIQFLTLQRLMGNFSCLPARPRKLTGTRGRIRWISHRCPLQWD